MDRDSKFMEVCFSWKHSVPRIKPACWYKWAEKADCQQETRAEGKAKNFSPTVYLDEDQCLRPHDIFILKCMGRMISYIQWFWLGGILISKIIVWSRSLLNLDRQWKHWETLHIFLSWIVLAFLLLWIVLKSRNMTGST